MACAVTVLPEPEFADQRQRAALFEPKGDAIDDRAPLAALREGDRQLAHVEKRRGLAHKNVFLGSKASRTASPMKMRSESMSAVTAKADSPIQGADRLDLPCSRSSPSEGEPGGMPKPKEVERGQRADRGIDDERQEGQRRHHGVRQHVLDDDLGVGEAERAGGVDIFEIARAQELGPDQVNEADPGEQQQDRQQDKEARREDRREDDENVEVRQR